MSAQACRLCGCTDDNACPPACWWVEADLCSTCSEKIEALGSHLLAQHGDYHVNDNAWTVCICGHIADGDDDDGSHARHVAEVLLASEWLARVVANAKAEALRLAELEIRDATTIPIAARAAIGAVLRGRAGRLVSEVAR